MIKYVNNNPKKFTTELAPIILGMMELSVAGFTELVNIVMICMQHTVMDCVLNFIALGTISQLDSIYANSLINEPIKKEVDEPLSIASNLKAPLFKERTCAGKLGYLLYKFWRLGYVSAYYYFTPYSTPLITYLFIGIKKGNSFDTAQW